MSLAQLFLLDTVAGVVLVFAILSVRDGWCYDVRFGTVALATGAPAREVLRRLR